MPLSIDASTTSASYALEVIGSPRTLPATPVWKALEVNTYSDFGADYKTTARKFIIPDRQEYKGSITDLDVTAGFTVDLTPTNCTDLMQGFLYANAREKPATQPFNGAQVAITSVGAGGVWNGVGIGALFPVGSIYLATGFTTSPTNVGIGVVTASAANSITGAADVTVADAAPASTANLRQVGVQATAGDLTMTFADPMLTLASTTLNLSSLGLNVGEWVFIGGDTAATQFATFSGFARIASIAAHAIAFDKVSFAPVSDTGVGKTVQLFFGTVIRNENLPANIVKRTYQFERQLGQDANGTMSEYVTGSSPNTVKYTQPAPGANAKTTFDLMFAPMGYQQFTGAQGIKAGTRVASPGEGVFSPTADLVRARIAAVNYDTAPGALVTNALLGYISEADFTINNAVTINKAAGVLGGFSTTLGTLAASGTLTAYFSDMTAKQAVSSYSDVTADWIYAKNNAGVVMDFPLVGLSGGKLTVDIDKPVMIPLTSDAFKGANGYTVLLNTFQYLPTLAMPHN